VALSVSEAGYFSLPLFSNSIYCKLHHDARISFNKNNAYIASSA
jgi:hypothetical protein